MKIASIIALLSYCYTSISQNIIYVTAQETEIRFGLYDINMDDCSSNLICHTDKLLDIALNPIDGNIYGTSQSGLVRINPYTGIITNIGSSIYYNALEFTNNGVLYGMKRNSDNLYTINTSNGNSTLLGSLGTGIGSGGDLLFHNGALYLSGFNPVGTGYCIKIDTAKLENTVIIGHFTGLANAVNGIAKTWCDQRVWAAVGSDIYEIFSFSYPHKSQLKCENIVYGHILGATKAKFHTESTLSNHNADTTLCSGEILTLDVSFPGATYQWQNGAIAPKLDVQQSNSYRVNISVDGCTKTHTFNVEFKDCCLNIPSAFTPNRDMTNDFFHVVSDCPFSDFQFLIFDRWGALIFRTDNIDQKWDGTVNGEKCSQGTYIWELRYRNLGHDEHKVKNGSVQLLR